MENNSYFTNYSNGDMRFIHISSNLDKPMLNDLIVGKDIIRSVKDDKVDKGKADMVPHYFKKINNNDALKEARFALFRAFNLFIDISHKKESTIKTVQIEDGILFFIDDITPLIMVDKENKINFLKNIRDIKNGYELNDMEFLELMCRYTDKMLNVFFE